MTIEVPCSGCGRTLSVGPEHAGKMARCPVCSHITLVPASGDSPAAVAAELPSASPPSAATWYMRTPEGQEYGPVTRADVDRWLAEGRIATDCFLRNGESAAWQSADQVFAELKPAPIVPTPMPTSATSPWVPPAPLPGYAGGQPNGPYFASHVAGPYSPQAAHAYQTQHRGALLLVLGLLGIFLQPCPGPIFALIAWVMGSNDLREMDAGRMDRSGRDLTRAGMILGMVLSLLWIIGFLIVAGCIFLASVAG